jgi:hypothetical protein
MVLFGGHGHSADVHDAELRRESAFEEEEGRDDDERDAHYGRYPHGVALKTWM